MKKYFVGNSPHSESDSESEEEDGEDDPYTRYGSNLNGEEEGGEANPDGTDNQVRRVPKTLCTFSVRFFPGSDNTLIVKVVNTQPPLKAGDQDYESRLTI